MCASSTRSMQLPAIINSLLSPIPSLLHETNQEILNRRGPQRSTLQKGKKRKTIQNRINQKPRNQQRKSSNIPANVSSVIANEMKPIIVDAKLSGANPWDMVIWISFPLPFLLSKIKKEKNDSYLSPFFSLPTSERKMNPRNGFTDFCPSLMRPSSSGIKVVRTYSSTERFRVKLEKQTKQPKEIRVVFRAQE